MLKVSGRRSAFFTRADPLEQEQGEGTRARVIIRKNSGKT